MACCREHNSTCALFTIARQGRGRIHVLDAQIGQRVLDRDIVQLHDHRAGEPEVGAPRLGRE